MKISVSPVVNQYLISLSLLSMANKTKTGKTKAVNPDQLKQEKEETVEVKQLLKDERTHKIAGSVLLLIAILLFIAFTSYLFTWQEDQSKVFKGAKILLPGHEEPVQNMLGAAGAYFSHIFFFIYMERRPGQVQLPDAAG